MADSGNIISLATRRAVLSGIAATSAGLAIPALANGRPDAELLALAAQYRALIPVYDAQTDDEAGSALYNELMSPIVEKMAGIEAQTIDGVGAKAWVLNDLDKCNDALIESVLDDLSQFSPFKDDA